MSEPAGYLTVTQVQKRLQAAGYTDSGNTIRRLLDAGQFGAEGTDWYRTERGGYRKISVTAVDRLIARRKAGRTSAE